MNWIEINKDSARFVSNGPLTDNYSIYLSPKKELKNRLNTVSVIKVDIDKFPTITNIKSALYNLQKEYDKDTEVNSFKLKHRRFWFDKATRVGLINSLTILKESGETNVTIWFGTLEHIVDIDYMLSFLKNLELYAIACNNITNKHLNEIDKLINETNLLNYNITKDYPPKLEFDITKIVK